MEYPAHDLPVTGLGFAPTEAGAKLGGYDLLAGSADYKITLFKSQGEDAADAVIRCGYDMYPHQRSFVGTQVLAFPLSRIGSVLTDERASGVRGRSWAKGSSSFQHWGYN